MELSFTHLKIIAHQVKIDLKKLQTLNYQNQLKSLKIDLKAGPDYGLVFKFVLTEKDCSELGSKIQESNDWIKQDEFWTFNKTVNGVIYNITFDKQKCKVIYNEDLI